MIAAIYARKSTEQNGVADEERSVTRQVEHARAYAARKGWAVADEHVYIDDGISGAEFATRPGYLRLMNACGKRAPFQVLIMSEESRLGRESIETAFALKQIVQANVRVFFYLEDRERTLDSPMDKIMLQLAAFADDLERDKARQRTYDALIRKARAHYVTGGACFGYDNVEVLSDQADASGHVKRAHVTRRINEAEAATIRHIFDLCAQGFGMRQIAYRLNAEAAPCPRPQQGRPRGWAPSSIRAILYRPLYRGEIVWNRTQKRNTWGQVQPRRRPEAEWLHLEAPELQIVTDAQWTAAHRRLGESRALYLRDTKGKVWGHPARGVESKYLLVGLATCGVCGAGLSVRRSRSGRHPAHYYVCTGNYHRGPRVCPNTRSWPMEDLDGLILDAIADQVLAPEAIDTIVSRVVELIRSYHPQQDAGRLAAALAEVNRRLDQLGEAVANGAGELPTLLDKLRDGEREKAALQAQLTALDKTLDVGQLDLRVVTERARAKMQEWRALLTRQVAISRQMVRKLTVGRLEVTPHGDRTTIRGTGTLKPLFGGDPLSQAVASPTGLAKKVQGAFRRAA